MDKNLVTKEVWKNIPGFIGYQASNSGHIRSFRIKGQKDKIANTPKILKAAPDKRSGYLTVMIRHEGKTLGRKVHRLVMETFVGPRPIDLQIAHLDGNPSNNAVTNLIYTTALINSGHKKIHGTQINAIGENVGGAKLSNQDVLKIKRRINSGESHHSIANDYPVNWDNIKAIHRGDSWAHLGEITLPFVPSRTHIKQDDYDYIVSSIKNGLSALQVAKIMGIDHSTPARIFRRETGMGIRQYRQLTSTS